MAQERRPTRGSRWLHQGQLCLRQDRLRLTRAAHTAQPLPVLLKPQPWIATATTHRFLRRGAGQRGQRVSATRRAQGPGQCDSAGLP